MNRIARNTAITLVSEVIARALSLALVIFATRRFGPGPFGDLAFAQSIVGYFLLVADLGFASTAVRDIAAAEPAQALELAGVVHSIRIAWGMLTTLVAGGVILMMTPGQTTLRELLLILLLTVPLSALSNQWLLTAHEAFPTVAFLRVFQPLISLGVLGAVSWTSRMTLQGYSVALLAGQLVFTLGTLLFSAKVKRAVPWKRVRLLGVPVFKAAFALGLSAILGRVYFDFDLILLRLMKTDEIAGEYAAAYKMVSLVLLVPVLLTQVMLPLLSRAGKRAGERLSQFLVLMFVLALPVLVGGVAVGPGLITTMFGHGYDLANQVIPWLMPSVAVIFLKTPATTALISQGQQTYLSKLAAAGAVVNVLLNLILIPLGHVFGAAIATLCTELMLVTLSYNRLRSLGISLTLRGVDLPVLASLVMSISLLVTAHLPSVFQVIVGAFTYLFAYVLLAKVRPDSFIAIRRLFLERTPD